LAELKRPFFSLGAESRAGFSLARQTLDSVQRWVLKRKDGPVFIEPKLEINKRIFCVINSQEIFWNA